ncbi:piggyBac transposable element-derived protein 4-like [Homalodisca vitripennis]|uniref:piggyBac transposable element-derived protein 4-like n=1 Tax=Homalodisca vitripennis TaxID=197043 RepID=UPI001EEB18A0|nr:piggyBac transposable element-derived protein 4-like [Homalodisca vitripennis]
MKPNGLVINFAVYAGVNDFDLGGVGHSKTVVLHLMQDRLDLGHAVHMDNYYNSFDLSKELLDRKTYTTGTLRPKRKNTPSEVVETKLARVEVTCYYADGVAIGKWHDKRDARFISTEHVLDMEECKNKRGETTMKLTAIIVEYNKYMKGVDRQDQMLAYYPVTRKTTRWYKKLGILIIEMMVVNSYKMFKSHSGLQRLSLYDYRLCVVERLLPPDYVSSNRGMRVDIQPTPGMHFAFKMPAAPSGRTLRKKCCLCLRKGKRKDTVFYCTKCPGQPGLCLGAFFVQFHSVT